MILPYLYFSAAGFLSGSVLFSYLLPKLFWGIDVTALSEDANPGTSNAMKHTNVPFGLLCLLLDLSKGMVPVYLALQVLDDQSPLFALVLAAPVLGHAFSPMLRFHGGKAIAVSFGVLLGALSSSMALFYLAAAYLFFSLVVVIHPNEYRTITAFVACCACCYFWEPFPFFAGTLLLSSAVIYRHLRTISAKPRVRLFSRQ